MNPHAMIPGILLQAAARRRQGFTLIEVLLAMAVFAIGFAMMSSVPSGAALLERRYEQIVEGELATRNAVEMVAARRAFWPMFEYAYVQPKVIEGAYAKAQGTSSLKKNIYDISDWPAMAGADAVAGGQLMPLAFDRTFNANMAPSGPAIRAIDADTQGDFEDCVTNNLAGKDGLWGEENANIDTESNLFKRAFDTNQSGIGESKQKLDSPTDGHPDLYCGTIEAPPQKWFCDQGDRTHFPKGRIHLCHNRLLPATAYPLEIRSYPTGRPVADRRVFVILGYVDRNLNCERRQWALTAVAMGKDPTDRWEEGDFGEVLGVRAGIDPFEVHGAYPIPPLSPLTSGPVLGGMDAPVRMLANPYGLYDKDATDFTNLRADNTFNHGHLDKASHTNRILWSGTVSPLSAAESERVPYPNLWQLPAIIYDWDKSLVQVAYPQEYLFAPARDEAGAYIGVDTAAPLNRRLKVGDRFISKQGGITFTVKAIREETRAAYAPKDRPHFQIIEVAPPLSTTALGGPASADPAVGNQRHGGNAYPYWRLRHIFIAPAPTGRTLSPWAWSNTVSGGRFMSCNPNQ